jgi:hypothetical protein
MANEDEINTLADEIYNFLRRTSEEDKSLVPTWSEVAQEYIRVIKYENTGHRWSRFHR